MTWVDALAVAAFGGGLLQGLASGALRQIAAVVGFVLALVLAVHGMDEAGALLRASLGISERAAPLAGFVAVFFAVELVVFAVARAVEGVLGALKLGVVNRVFGGALGGLRGLLVLSALLVPLGYVGLPRAETREASRFYEPVVALLPWVWGHSGGVLGGARSLGTTFGRLVGDAEAVPADSLAPADTPPSAP